MKIFQQVSKRVFYLGLLPVILAVSVWQGWSWWSWVSGPVLLLPNATESAVEDTKVRIRIARGTSAQQIGRDLAAAGLIRSETAWNGWYRWLRLQDRQGGFKAGTYELSPAETMAAIAAKLWKGEVVQQSFTIPEGWSLRQMAAYFEAQGFFTAQEFLTAASQIPYPQYPWLPPNLPHLEGFLYPDTYQFPGEGITADGIVQQMLNRFSTIALPLYQENQQSSQKSEFTLLQWVTLASIVEKEAVVASERTRIAGVFTRRLREGIPLGADPTVEYGLGVQQTPDRPLTLSQVKTPSAYNTYLNPGLPPTPIASPGLANLKATLNPENTDYLYFVAKYDGTHVFSRTLQEHEAAQAAIRKERQAQQK